MQLTQELIEYLNGYTFTNRFEVSGAVQDYMMEEMGILEPSVRDCLEAGELADEYIEKCKPSFEG